MTPGTYNITIYKGSTFTIKVGATDGDNTAIDLASIYTSARLHIRPSWFHKYPDADSEPLLEMTTANGRITMVGSVITLQLTSVETSALTFRTGIYDLELVASTIPETVDKLLRGSVTVVSERTI